jgi:hypothetical protein
MSPKYEKLAPGASRSALRATKHRLEAQFDAQTTNFHSELLICKLQKGR